MLERQNSQKNDATTKVIVVGHQPVFFHPGILAKFVAASELAQICDAKVVHLVVDHHIGDVGLIEVPKLQNRLLEVEKIRVAACNDAISLCDQSPLNRVPNKFEFSQALKNNEPNAAMQVAAATDELMLPYAEVHQRISATELLQSSCGKELLDRMFTNPESCRTAYNNAVLAFPNCGIPCLDRNELPLWHGPHNERVSTQREDLRPRALLLTLLARTGLGDLFVHGTGGSNYDLVMEQWCRDWLGVEPCPQVIATTTLNISFTCDTVESLRKSYFSGGNDHTKRTFLEKINTAPVGSAERQVIYAEMHRWLASCQEKPNYSKLRTSQRVASRRDWAFPLYEESQLLSLTKDLLVPR